MQRRHRPEVAVIAVSALCLVLGGCATARAPTQVASGPRTEPGTIVQARPIVDVITAPPPIAPPPADGPGGQQVPRDLPVTKVETVITPVIGQPLRPGETPRAVAYTVRRVADGVSFEVAQPNEPALAAGARVQIVYDARVRLVPY